MSCTVCRYVTARNVHIKLLSESPTQRTGMCNSFTNRKLCSNIYKYHFVSSCSFPAARRKRSNSAEDFAVLAGWLLRRSTLQCFTEKFRDVVRVHFLDSFRRQPFSLCLSSASSVEPYLNTKASTVLVERATSLGLSASLVSSELRPNPRSYLAYTRLRALKA